MNPNNKFNHALPVMLSVTGSLGVIATSILSSMSAIKSNKKIEDATEKKGSKLTFNEKLKLCWKDYILASSIGFATIASITVGTIVSKKIEASLASALVLLDQGYNKYKGKVKNIFGLEGNKNILKEISKDDYEKISPDKPRDGEKLYWNMYLGFFYAKPEKIMESYNNMNMRLNAENGLEMFPSCQEGWCTLDQFIDEAEARVLEPEKAKNFALFGWTKEYLKDIWDDNWLYLSMIKKGKLGSGIVESKNMDTFKHNLNLEELEHNEYIILEFCGPDPIFDPVAYMDYSKSEYIHAYDCLNGYSKENAKKIADSCGYDHSEPRHKIECEVDDNDLPF